MPATNRKASSQPFSFSSLETQRVTQTQTNLALDKATFLQLSPGSLPNPCLDTPQASSTSLISVPTKTLFQG